MPAITIPRNEQGKIRVFSLSLTDNEAKELGSDAPGSEPLARAMGLKDVNADAVEVFRVSDLSELGLLHYLTEGMGAVSEQVSRDRTKLSQLEGWVMVVRSAAFGPEDTVLTPMPALTLIGTYDEERPDMTVSEIESAAAQPYTGTPTGVPVTPPKGKSGGMLITAAIVVAILLLLWWLFS